MRDHPGTTRRRRPGTRVGAATAAVVTVLVAGCSGGSPGAATPPRSSPPGTTSSPSPPRSRTAAPPSPAPSSPAPSSPAVPPPAPRRTRPAQDTVRPATARQVVGLVRIVASIGTDGRGETSTGMVLRGDGEVLTNGHAVSGATAVQATVLSAGRTYPAQVVGTDRGRDVALLHLAGASGLATVRLAPHDAAVGDRVTTVGDARGRRSTFTAATGRLLATRQTLVTPTTGTTPGERLTGVLLSSCDVVAGESGGPTYDVRNHVVGMTTAAVRTRSGLFGVAIPVSTLRGAVRALERRPGS